MWPFQSSQSATSAEELPSHRRLLEESLDDSRPNPADTITDTLTGNQYVRYLGSEDWSNERLQMPLPIRTSALMVASFCTGFALGFAQGSPKAADRYRAENAHRLPTTQAGWYLYHKSKGYHQTAGGLREGAKFGGVCTTWALLFMITEHAVDQSRARLFASGDDEEATGQRDAASSIIAAMSMSGIYSWKNGLDHWAAGRTAKTALKFSLAYGLAQDVLATMRGSPPGYIRFLTGKT